jgi:hypothetical protein
MPDFVLLITNSGFGINRRKYGNPKRQDRQQEAADSIDRNHDCTSVSMSF